MAEDYALAALATVVAYALAAALALGIKEVRPPERERREPVRAFFRLLGGTVRQGRFLLLLFCWAMYEMVLGTVCTWLSQNQYLRCGMSGAAMGWVFLLVTAADMAGTFSKRVTDRLGRARSAVGAAALTALACLALVFTRSPVVSVGCILAMEAGYALVGPLASQVWNRQVTTADRATQLSIYAVLDEAVAAAGILILGRAADVSLDTAFLLGGAVCLVCAALIGLFCRRYFAA